MSVSEAPIGAVLAGGFGRRIGEAKALAPLRGRPLISYPVQALRQALEEVVIVAKAGIELPELPGVAVWTEPDTPQHPLVGIVAALERAAPRAVVICGCDMPLLRAGTVRRLVQDARGGDAVLASGGGRRQPLLGCYRQSGRSYLTQQLRENPDAGLQQIVGGLDWVAVEVAEEELFNVNTPHELTRATELLVRGSEPPDEALEPVE